MSRKNKYSLEIKLSAVEKVLEQQISVMKIANEIGVAKSQLQRWLRYYKRYGEEGLKPKSNHYTGDFKLKLIKTKHVQSNTFITKQH